ncbi:hypothetical protein NM688_g5836 [Phlebia brevispora]|uniref:Uncharacterized protein n=1 Tax=Phlebia brevispora TaxID=194682 RepID=A0ACC1SNU4_9APHY|nr:hypothetical protein NM688_g5836 [Phlebia brevispora]
MYSGDNAPLQSGLVEQAGTLDFHSLNPAAIPKPNGSHMEGTNSRQVLKTARTEETEQTLEWHEVIELQAFSERKAWIEEKIKFLEKMPPVEVFTGLDAIRSSAEEVPGLPSRAELEQWLVEHDKIEKETEIFDSGELAKLKKFTKAATQRNLSPADTDLIELTLTTICGLDKLLHLLRDRSDNLELLGIRLIWEERRIAAWRELRSILADLGVFLHSRGRWSPSVYDSSLSEEEDPLPAPEQSPPIVPSRTLRRKGSMVSLASSTSDSVIPSLVMSRSERFKLAERLSREAAQFSSRVSSLKHNKINAAGKALDRLIDTSRRAVPDELLDEQDRLEDQGLNGMEDIGKADEIYVETMKDKNSAQTLMEEIETAKLFHPTSRQDTAFLARITTLMKRLEMRGDPSAPNSSFPQPSHPLFEDQEEYNTTIVETLSNELRTTAEFTRKAEVAAKEYHANHEAVKRVEALCKAATDISEKYSSILERLEKGTENPVGDGHPPDLSTEECLQPISHSVFLSLFPALSDELVQCDQEATALVRNERTALLDIGRPGVDPQFASDSVATIDRLDQQRVACARARDMAVVRVSTLKQVRETWSSMARALEQLDDVRSDIVDAIKRDMWKSQAQQNAATLTPESPTSVLPPSEIAPPQFSQRLDAIRISLQHEILDPLAVVSSSLGPRLKIYLSSCASGLSAALEDAQRMASFSQSVRAQAEAMFAVREEAHALQMRLEDLKICFDGAVQQALAGEDESRLSVEQADLQKDLDALQETIHTFLDELPRRVPFVTRTGPSVSTSQTGLGARRRFSVSGFSLDVIQQATFTTYPVNPPDLDQAVRTDVNSYSMLLSGTFESVRQRGDLLQVAFIARDVDRNLLMPVDLLERAAQTVTSVQQSLDEQSQTPLPLEQLSSLADVVDRLYPEHGPAIASSLVTVNGFLDQLNERLNKHDATIAATMLGPRRRRVEDTVQQFNSWKENVEVLSERIADLRHLEQVRIAEAAERELEEQRLDEERRLRAEQERFQQEQEQEQERQRQAEAQSRKEAQARAKATEQLLFPLTEDMEDDVFSQEMSSASEQMLSQELSDLQAQVPALRKRLRHLGIDEMIRPDKQGTAPLPKLHHTAKLEKELSDIIQEVEVLPGFVKESLILDAEIRSLRSGVASASKDLTRIKQLAHLASDIQACDNALSDLLEHIDSFPAPPVGPLGSSYASDTSMPPEEQLTARLSFTRGLIDEIVLQCVGLADDSRAVSERDRILQTWEELQAMGLDRINGQKSRPASVLSSGRSSRASAISTATASSSGASTKAPVFPRRAGSRTGGQFLAPPPPTRRVASANSVNGHSRPTSRASISSKREVPA